MGVAHENRAGPMDDALRVERMNEGSDAAPISCIPEELPIAMGRVEIDTIRRQRKWIAACVNKQVILDVLEDCLSSLFCNRRVWQHRTQLPEPKKRESRVGCEGDGAKSIASLRFSEVTG